MKKMKFLLLVPALLLCACQGETSSATPSLPPASSGSPSSSPSSSSPSSSSSKGPVQVEIPTYDGIPGTPSPILLQGEAPKDYEGVSPLDVIDDGFKAYTLIDHRLANTNYYCTMNGIVDVNVDIVGMHYSQNVSSVKAFVGTTGVSQAVALSKDTFANLSVNNVEQRLEDVRKGYYGYRRGIASTSWIDEETGLGHVQDWEEKDISVNSRPTFLDTFGHDLCGVTNYYVPDSGYVSLTRAAYEEGKYTFDFEFSTSEEKNAGKYYLREQQHMMSTSGSGITSSMVELSIRTLAASIVVDETFLPISMHVEETYQASLQAFDLVRLTSSFDTKFVAFEGENIPDAYVEDIFDETLSSLREVA